MLLEAEKDVPSRAEAGPAVHSPARERRNAPASDENEAPSPPSAGAGRPWTWALIIVLLAAGLAGWWYRDAVRSFAEPLLVRVGWSSGARADVSAEACCDRQSADGNAVVLDAEGQRRLGLAFGRAETRRIVRPVRTPGMVAFDERRVTRLKPRSAGRVLSLAVQPGDRVSAGQTLATLDSAGVLDARNGLAAAEASLGEAQATERVAETNLKRGSDLVKIGGVAQAEVDRRQVELAKAHAATLSAKAQVTLYQAQYARLAPAAGEAPGTSAILSPIPGVVTMAASRWARWSIPAATPSRWPTPRRSRCWPTSTDATSPP